MAAFTWKLKLPFNLFCFNDFLLLIVLLWGWVSAFLLLYWIESGRFYERDEPDIIFSFCLGNQWHFVDLLKCGQKWWMFSYFRMLTKSHTHASERHNSAVTVLLRATETFLLEGTPLFILLSSAMYQSKWVSLCVYFLSLSRVMFGGLYCFGAHDVLL